MTLSSLRVLYISPVPTHPATAGNRQGVTKMLEAFETLGVDYRFLFLPQEPADVPAMQARWGRDRVIVFPHECPRRPNPLWRKLRNRTLRYLGLEKYHPWPLDAYYHAGLAQFVQRLAAEYQPTTVIVAYVFWSWLLELFPATVHKIVDTHDVLGDRFRRFAAAGLRPEWWALTRRDERRGLCRADAILAVQEHEAVYFRQLTGRPTFTMGHITPLQPLPEPPPQEPTLLYVGSSNDTNRHGLRWFLDQVWPRLPAVRVLLAGKICERFPTLPPGVEALGIVPDLRAAYGAAHVVFNPVQLGTGLKIKCVEALSFGRALVTTPVGAEGMEEAAGRAFVVASTPAEFATACVDLLKDAPRRRQLAEAGLKFVEQWNERARAALAAALQARTQPATSSLTSTSGVIPA